MRKYLQYQQLPSCKAIRADPKASQLVSHTWSYRSYWNANLTISDNFTFKICANSHDSIEQRKDTVGVEVKSENQHEVKIPQTKEYFGEKILKCCLSAMAPETMVVAVVAKDIWEQRKSKSTMDNRPKYLKEEGCECWSNHNTRVINKPGSETIKHVRPLKIHMSWRQLLLFLDIVCSLCYINVKL